MLKRLILILTIILTLTTTATETQAADNYLNSVLLEGTDSGYNVVLRSDEVTKVKKEVQSADKIVLTLKGIVPSSNLTTLYKDTADVNNLIVENNGNNEVKVYIQAHDISKANIVFDTPNSAPIPVGDTFGTEKTMWSLISVGILLLAMKSAKSIQNSTSFLEYGRDISKDIKDREIKMYKNFKREIAKMPSINYKISSTSYATSSIRVREAKRETLRNLESSHSTFERL